MYVYLIILSLWIPKAGIDPSQVFLPVLPAITLEATHPGLKRSEGRLWQGETLFSGYLVEYYENGALKSNSPYWNGQLWGTAVTCYANGRFQSLRSYRDNRREGLHIGWWENGEKHFVYSFNRDLHQGQAKEWFADGQLYRAFNYEKGREIGRQQMWRADGSLQANYVMRNGKRYGWIGSKQCYTVDNTSSVVVSARVGITGNE